MLRGICVAVALGMAGPVSAKLVQVTMTGTIATKGSGLFTVTDTSPLAIGDEITATLVFNDSYKHVDGTKIYYGAQHYGGSMRVQAGPFTWNERGDFNDGSAEYADNDIYGEIDEYVGISRPLLTFENGVFIGFLTKADNYLQAGIPDIRIEGFGFKMDEMGALLDYRGPTFAGFFDPESVRISPIPEPETWAMMLAGFVGIGAAMRRRQSHVALPR